MLLGYSIYLVRAVVSAMVAVFLLFIRRKYYIHTKYKYAHVGVAVSAILDCLMDIWGCWLIVGGYETFDFHWVWAVVYYIQWTVLGFCAMKLVESKHGFFWFPPLMLWYVIADSIQYRKRIDDVYAGDRSEQLHELSRMTPFLLCSYFALTLVDLAITDNYKADLFVVCLATVVVVVITVLIFNFQTLGPLDGKVMDSALLEKSGASELGGIEAKVREWENRPDRPYCKEDVSLYNVADQMRVSTRVLSSYINSVKMMNFNTWINGLRVEEINRILSDDPDSDYYDLMCASGFQSRASLCRAVKNNTGRTLSELRRILAKG